MRHVLSPSVTGVRAIAGSSAADTGTAGLVEHRKREPSSSTLPDALTWQKAPGMYLTGSTGVDLCLSQQAQHVGDT